jgi:hypothetical protein
MWREEETQLDREWTRYIEENGDGLSWDNFKAFSLATDLGADADPADQEIDKLISGELSLDDFRAVIHGHVEYSLDLAKGAINAIDSEEITDFILSQVLQKIKQQKNKKA